MTPQAYLQHALQIVEDRAYYQPTPATWQPLTQQLLQKAARLNTIPAVYPLLRDALTALRDGHSHLHVPGERRTKESASAKPVLLPKGDRLSEWGYIHLPKAAGDETYYQQYADAGHKILRQAGHASGWMIDLRGNRGGNMWPMLTAIGPLVGEGILGYHVRRSGHRVAWGYNQGASFWEDETIYSVKNPIPPLEDTIPLALLTNDHTASSGEAILIACLGRANLCTFGQFTRGIPTANSSIALPDVPGADDAFLTLTTDVTADCTGRIYTDPIRPHVICANPLEAAQQWLSRVAGT